MAAASGRRRAVTALAAGAIAVAAGAAWATSAEWVTIRRGFGALAQARPGWIGAAMLAQAVSMTAFVLVQWGLLRAVGGRLPWRWLLFTEGLANAIAWAVPVAGSGLAAGFAYRRFRQAGADPAAAALVLALGGIISTVAFAAMMVLAAVACGNPAAAAGSLAAAAAVAGVAATAVLALHSARGRVRLTRAAVRLVRLRQRIMRGPRGDPGVLVAGALDSAGGAHLSGAAAAAFVWALLNWVADASCLVVAIKAVGAAVPWHRVLLAWSAGIGARSVSPTPGGIGVIEAAMVAALVAAGLRPPQAVAAVLIYRLANAKLVGATVLFVRGSLRRLRQHPRRAA